MANVQEIQGKLLEGLRAEQLADGSWMGELKSGMLNFYYAAALALDGGPPDSACIQDICDFFESCAENGNGLGIHPGEPATPMSSYQGALLFGWARPQSPALASARSLLDRKGMHPPSIPLFMVSRWIFDPAARAEVL